MTRHLDVPKSDPAAVAKLAIDAIASGDADIIADETSTRAPGRALRRSRRPYPQVA